MQRGNRRDGVNTATGVLDHATYAPVTHSSCESQYCACQYLLFRHRPRSTCRPCARNRLVGNSHSNFCAWGCLWQKKLRYTVGRVGMNKRCFFHCFVTQTASRIANACRAWRKLSVVQWLRQSMVFVTAVFCQVVRTMAWWEQMALNRTSLWKSLTSNWEIAKLMFACRNCWKRGGSCDIAWCSPWS